MGVRPTRGRAPLGRGIMLVAVVLLLAGTAAAWMAGGLMLRGRSTPVAPASPPAIDLHLRARDGVVLAATYRPGARRNAPAILLLHGIGQSRAAVAENAAWLAVNGYATLAIDFRGHGQSTQRSRSLGWFEAVDAHAAFYWLKRHQHGAPIGVVGISLGGAASLLGADGPVPADALVLQAVYPDLRHAIRHRIVVRLGSVAARLLEPLLSFQTRPRLGVWPDSMSPLTALRHYKRSVLVIGGQRDRATPPSETRALFNAAPGRKALWLVASGDHADVCALQDGAYRAHLLRFFRRTIGG